MARYLCSIVFLLFALQSYAQVRTPVVTGSSEPGKVFRVEVNLVQVDAVVTDKKGRPVTDLTADDFVVYQDGKRQEITSFSMVRMDVDKKPAPPAPVESKQDEWKVSAAPPLHTEDLRKDEVKRTIALVVDDLGLSFQGTYYTREALKNWVDKKMQPGDLVAVILTGSGMGSLQQFTTDKRMLHAAIDRITYNLMGRVGVSSFAAISSMESTMSQYATDERNMMITQGTIGAIQYVIAGLRDVPGRKSLILFSEDMRMFVGNDRDFFMESPLQRMIDEANRSAVVIHAIDPRGVVYTGTTAEDNLSGLSGEQIASISGDRTADYMASQDGMFQITEMTGGLFEHDRNDINTALEEVVDDGKVYYLIGYVPDEKTAERMQQGLRRFHSIRVQVNRKGLQVRSRSGFFGTTNIEAEPLTRREKMRQALYSPFASGDLPVRLTSLFSRDKEKNVRINALLHFDADQLDYRFRDGWHQADVDIVATTFDANGEQIDLVANTWTLMAKPEAFEVFKRNGVVILMYIPVKKAGAYQTRVVVSDTASGLMGTASQFVEVPDVGKGNLALSGIALASERQQLDAITGREEGVLDDREINGSPAVRVFKQGDTIMWAYQVLNAKAGKNNKSQLQTYARLFYEGKEVYSADMHETAPERQEDADTMIGYGKMELLKMVPGDYALQVIVSDKLAKKKNQVAAQAINFSILNPDSRVSSHR